MEAMQHELNAGIGNIEALINKILSLNSNYNFRTLKYLKITGNIAIIAMIKIIIFNLDFIIYPLLSRKFSYSQMHTYTIRYFLTFFLCFL